MAEVGGRILVVDDDETIRSVLEIALQEEGYEVWAEADGSEIQVVAAEFRPDLAILDVRLPLGPDGYEIAGVLRQTRDVPVMFLTAAAGVEERLTGFRSGADDYVVKPFFMAELLARVEALLRRSGRTATRTVGPDRNIVIDCDAHVVTRGERSLKLTRTEFDLLWALAERPGVVISKRELLARVWGVDSFDPNLVEVHMSSLRRKLEEHGPRVIATVRQVGYVLKN